MPKCSINVSCAVICARPSNAAITIPFALETSAHCAGWSWAVDGCRFAICVTSITLRFPSATKESRQMDHEPPPAPEVASSNKSAVRVVRWVVLGAVGIWIAFFLAFLLFESSEPNSQLSGRTVTDLTGARREDDLQLWVQRFSQADADHSTLNDTPRPPFVTRWLTVHAGARAGGVPCGCRDR